MIVITGYGSAPTKNPLNQPSAKSEGFTPISLKSTIQIRSHKYELTIKYFLVVFVFLVVSVMSAVLGPNQVTKRHESESIHLPICWKEHIIGL